MKTLSEVDELSMEEYEWRIKAYQLQRLDMERERHQLVWLTRMVDATDKKGHYIYGKFDEFYDEKKMRIQLGIDSPIELKRVADRRKQLADIARRVNSLEVNEFAKES